MATTPLDLALDDMAWEAAAATGAAPLGEVVRALERAAGASLGDTDGEEIVVLQRRFARAHRLLLSGGGRPGGSGSDPGRAAVVTEPERVAGTTGLGESAPLGCLAV